MMSVCVMMGMMLLSSLFLKSVCILHVLAAGVHAYANGLALGSLVCVEVGDLVWSLVEPHIIFILGFLIMLLMM
jgi:hypothetical protein